jgi:hypothetical protein
MSEIYRWARGVMAWLGEEDEGSGEAFGLLRARQVEGGAGEFSGGVRGGVDGWDGGLVGKMRVVMKVVSAGVLEAGVGGAGGGVGAGGGFALWREGDGPRG